MLGQDRLLLKYTLHVLQFACWYKLFFLSWIPTSFLPAILSSPTGYSEISTCWSPTKEFQHFHEAFQGPQLEYAPTFSELPKYFMFCISGSIFIVKDNDKWLQIVRGTANG